MGGHVGVAPGPVQQPSHREVVGRALHQDAALIAVIPGQINQQAVAQVDARALPVVVHRIAVMPGPVHQEAGRIIIADPLAIHIGHIDVVARQVGQQGHPAAREGAQPDGEALAQAQVAIRVALVVRLTAARVVDIGARPVDERSQPGQRGIGLPLQPHIVAVVARVILQHAHPQHAGPLGQGPRLVVVIAAQIVDPGHPVEPHALPGIGCAPAVVAAPLHHRRDAKQRAARPQQALAAVGVVALQIHNGGQPLRAQPVGHPGLPGIGVAAARGKDEQGAIGVAVVARRGDADLAQVGDQQHVAGRPVGDGARARGQLGHRALENMPGLQHRPALDASHQTQQPVGRRGGIQRTALREYRVQLRPPHPQLAQRRPRGRLVLRVKRRRQGGGGQIPFVLHGQPGIGALQQTVGPAGRLHKMR